MTGALMLDTVGCLGSGSGGFGNGTVTTIDCEIPGCDTVNPLPTPAIGSEDASVVVGIWEDFTCPHCATFAVDVAPQPRSEYVSEGIIHYRYRDFPIPVDEWWLRKGASAARVVRDEADDETFFDFTHMLYEDQSELGGGGTEGSLLALQSLVADTGLNGCSVATAAPYERYRLLAEAERTEAVDERGFQGMPTALIDGEQVAPRWSDLQRAVENAR